jgi:WD40 repeat protein
VRLFRPTLILGLVLLAICACMAPTSAQDTSKIDLVPSIPHSERVTLVALSPDGTRVLSGSIDKTIRLWDVATGVLLRAFEGHSGAKRQRRPFPPRSVMYRAKSALARFRSTQSFFPIQ